MPSSCSVRGCTNTDKTDPNLKFHILPKEGSLKQKWLTAIKRSEKELHKRPKVCSQHFIESDYTITRLNYSMSTKNNPSPSRNTCEWKVLKPNTIPTLNLPGNSTIKIKISKKNNDKEVKIEEVKTVEQNKGKMPKKHVEVVVRPRTQSRRAASKEALKQMQLLLDDYDDDTVEIPSDDEVVPVEPSPPPPPKKKYKLSHRKSSDGHDRDVIVLKSITNHNVENTLELECWVEQLEEVQNLRIKKMEEEEKQLQEKLESLIKSTNAEVIHKGDLNTVIEINEQIQSALTAAAQPAPQPTSNLILNSSVAGSGQSYQLVMDPRLGFIVGAVTSQSPTTPTSTPQNVYPKGKVQIAQGLQQIAATPTTSQTNTRAMRTRRGGNAIATPRSAATPTAANATRGSVTATANATRGSVTATANATRGSVTATANVTRGSVTATANATRGSVTATPNATRGSGGTATSSNTTRGSVGSGGAGISTRGSVVAATTTHKSSPTITPASISAPQTRSGLQTRSTPARAAPAAKVAQPPAKPAPPVKKTVVVNTPPPNTRARISTNTFANVRPSESSVEGGLATGDGGATPQKSVVDLTTEDGRPAPDSREISFNKLQGKTYPSLVVVARPHLRVLDLNVDRPKLDAKVKSVLMHAPTKFTEWLIQQGLVRSEQKCSVHATQLKLGMYSDVSKFPYSGGYVWISECCPQRFVSVFSGSLFEGSPHPPMVILKLLYHWSCQTNIQNVTQWVKVDNFYVKGMFTWLRSICTVALQTHIRQLGGPGVKVEVGVISLGTTSQDGNQRQVKVEVLGILESNSKLIRLRAVEPQADGDRNYKKRFSKILEPIFLWVHPQSILVADLTVDKQTLHNMGFANVVQSTSSEFGSNRQIMEYLRRIVPRMFQNTLSLLSRQIIQQFLDELVWREWFGTSSLQAFDNLVVHLSEQTRIDGGQSLLSRLNKVAQNPFKNWAITLPNSTPKPPVENIQKKTPRTRKPEPAPKVTQNVTVDVNRPPKSNSPDVPEQMVPLENYYYGTIDQYAKSINITLSMKCPLCKLIFNNNIQLMNHLFKHAHNVSQDAQLCRYCLTSVPTANDLLKHIATSHPAETKFDNGFVCLICETQYMNPFVLGKHMSKEHCPSEMPYQCGTCGYRCSNHKQVVDHFYKQHNNGPTIQCPFCLKSTTVFSSSRNIVQNVNYFIQHLQKHQRKQFARRCGKCNLWFVQKDVLKEHQIKMHVSQRGKNGLIPWNAPRNGVMVPKSKMDKYPGDADVINFTTLYFNVSKNLLCKECNTPMDTPKHFPSFESCQNPNCQYSTCCTNAMQEHNAKCSKNYNPVAEEKLPFEMFCICGHSDTDGNQMARHLAICERKSAYPSLNDAKSAIVTHSMLDVLGLVRKPEEGPSGIKSRTPSFSSKKKPDIADKEVIQNNNSKDNEVIEMIEDEKAKDENGAQTVKTLRDRSVKKKGYVEKSKESVKKDDKSNNNDTPIVDDEPILVEDEDKTTDETKKESEKTKKDEEVEVVDTKNNDAENVVNEIEKQCDKEAEKDNIPDDTSDVEIIEKVNEVEADVEEVSKKSLHEAADTLTEDRTEVVESPEPLKVPETTEKETNIEEDEEEAKITTDNFESESSHTLENQVVDEKTDNIEGNLSLPVKSVETENELSDIQNIASDTEELNAVCAEALDENYSKKAEEHISSGKETETLEVIQEKTALATEITSDDIQNIISDVVGQKTNSHINFEEQNMDVVASMETETDITDFSTGEESQDPSPKQINDVTMQIPDESMEVPESSNEAMECEVVTPMETD